MMLEHEDLMFMILEDSHDGYLDRNEVADGLEKLKLPCTPEILNQIFEQAHVSKDGLIAHKEFAAYVVAREHELQQAFGLIDVDRDGRLNVKEIQNALRHLGLRASEKEAKAFVESISRNGDSSVAFQEFRDFLLLLPTNSLRKVFDSWAKAAQVDIGEDATIPDDLEGGKPAYLANFVAGAAAGAVSRTLTSPMDRLKVILQAKGGSSSIRAGFQSIYADGGALAFFRGNGANVIKIMPESALKFMSYERLKYEIATDFDDPEPWEKFLAGAGAGVVSQAAIYPLEIAKTRLAVSKAGEYNGIIDVLERTVRQEGILAMYKGLGASLIGIAPYAGVDLCVFMTLKEEWIKMNPHARDGPGPLTLLGMGCVSSTTGAVIAYPLQLIRTRLQTQGMNAEMPIRYKGPMDCFRQTVKNNGVLGLYSGLKPNLLKTLPAVATSYLVYENVKKMIT